MGMIRDRKGWENIDRNGNWEGMGNIGENTGMNEKGGKPEGWEGKEYRKG